MKCPKCGINYDDSDRECPMCGAPKPLFGKDKSMLAKSTAKPADEIGETQDEMGSKLDLGSSNPKWQKSKKSVSTGTIIAIVIIAIFVISVIPSIFTAINSMDSFENTLIVTKEEPFDDIAQLEKQYTIEDENLTNIYIYSDETYYVSSIDYDEWGYITSYLYDSDDIPELKKILEENGITSSDFNIYVAILTADDSIEDKYMLMAESINGDYTVFYDINSNIPWLDDDTFVHATM